ncbi:RING finger domain-containing protein [Candidatus Dependentiae bacterium]
MFRHRSFIVKLTLIALISSSLQTRQAQATFSTNIFSGIKKSFNNANKTIKTGLYVALGLLGYKSVIKPISSFILGKRVTNTIDGGINFSLFTACVLGASYLYDKFILKGSIAKSIQNFFNPEKKKQIKDTKKQPQQKRDKTKEKITKKRKPKKKNKPVKKQEKENCTICLCEMENNRNIKELVCKHKFHENCIDKWIKQNRTCPICRRFAETKKEQDKRKHLGKKEREETLRKLKLADDTKRSINRVLSHTINSRSNSPCWCLKSSHSIAKIIDDLVSLEIITNNCLDNFERVCLNIGIIPLIALEIIQDIVGENSQFSSQSIIDEFINNLKSNGRTSGPRYRMNYMRRITHSGFIHNNPIGSFNYRGAKETSRSDAKNLIKQRLQRLKINIYISTQKNNNDNSLKIEILKELIWLGVIKKEETSHNEQTSLSRKIKNIKNQNLVQQSINNIENGEYSRININIIYNGRGTLL